MLPGVAMEMDKGENPAKIDYMKKGIENSWEKMKSFPSLMGQTFWKVGKEDPRRVIHSFKVGLSLTLVSLLVLLKPLFKGIGHNAMWAVMTVVVVLEFTAGATLRKGLNRGIGTLVAGSLAFLFKYVAQESDRVFRAIFIGAAVFFIGTASTYTRFIPYIKKNYDYGVVIFLLTFNLITASSYRSDNVVNIAHERLYTIAIGCGICLLMSLLVFPHWSGEDLHNSTVSKLEGLAKSIEACVNEYFSDEETKLTESKLSDDPIYKCYKAVLDSKSNDETLALQASWEPRHSRQTRLPWQLYVKLGNALRHFGYTVVALHGCLQTGIQTPGAVRALFKDPCTRLAAEVTKDLLELAKSIRNRRQCSPEMLSDHLHQALQDLNAALKSQPRLFLGPNSPTTSSALAAAAQRSEKEFPVSLSSAKTDSPAPFERKSNERTSQQQEAAAKETDRRKLLGKIAMTSLEFSEALPFAAFASLLVETVARLDLIIEEVEELGRMASFKEFKSGDDGVHAVTPKMEILNGGNLEKNHLPSHAVGD